MRPNRKSFFFIKKKIETMDAQAELNNVKNLFFKLSGIVYEVDTVKNGPIINDASSTFISRPTKFCGQLVSGDLGCSFTSDDKGINSSNLKNMSDDGQAVLYTNTFVDYTTSSDIFCESTVRNRPICDESVHKKLWLDSVDGRDRDNEWHVLNLDVPTTNITHPMEIIGQSVSVENLLSGFDSASHDNRMSSGHLRVDGEVILQRKYNVNSATVTKNDSDFAANNKECDMNASNEECEKLQEATEPLVIKPKDALGCDNSSMFVETSDQGSKKLCCPFCNKLVVKLALHMERKHIQEPDVRRFSVLEKGSKARRSILDSLRKIGSSNHNKIAALNGGRLIVSRRVNPKRVKSNPNRIKAALQIFCPFCLGTYAKTGLRFHVKNKCPNRPIPDERMKDERIITKLAKSAEGRYHQDASPALRKVFQSLTHDEIVIGIRFDWLIIVYGNKLSKKYTRRNSPAMIQNKLRLAGRVLFALKEIDPKVTDFASLYRPKQYNNVVKAIEAIARIDEVRKEFVAPATASSAVTTVRQIGQILISEYIKQEKDEKVPTVKSFLEVVNTDMHIDINKMVNETQARMKRQKKVILPLSSDVKLLSQYLEKQRTDCFGDLSKAFTIQKWKELSQLTMASIIVFNRRRVGDTQNILEEDYECKETMNESTNEELMSNLSDRAKQIAKQYSRMQVRGKKNRTVPVLLKSDVESCLNLLLTHREDAGIPSKNLFLFARPSKIDDNKVVDAGGTLRKFSKACGAKEPSRLTATNLRKHMATVCVSLKLDDTAVADVAQHLGHHEKVHREYYRQNTIDRQVVRISQYLEAAQGNSLEEFED